MFGLCDTLPYMVVSGYDISMFVWAVLWRYCVADRRKTGFLFTDRWKNMPVCEYIVFDTLFFAAKR